MFWGRACFAFVILVAIIPHSSAVDLCVGQTCCLGCCSKVEGALAAINGDQFGKGRCEDKCRNQNLNCAAESNPFNVDGCLAGSFFFDQATNPTEVFRDAFDFQAFCCLLDGNTINVTITNTCPTLAPTNNPTFSPVTSSPVTSSPTKSPTLEILAPKVTKDDGQSIVIVGSAAGGAGFFALIVFGAIFFVRYNKNNATGVVNPKHRPSSVIKNNNTAELTPVANDIEVKLFEELHSNVVTANEVEEKRVNNGMLLKANNLEIPFSSTETQNAILLPLPIKSSTTKSDMEKLTKKDPKGLEIESNKKANNQKIKTGSPSETARKEASELKAKNTSAVLSAIAYKRNTPFGQLPAVNKIETQSQDDTLTENVEDIPDVFKIAAENSSQKLEHKQNTESILISPKLKQTRIAKSKRENKTKEGEENIEIVVTSSELGTVEAATEKANNAKPTKQYIRKVSNNLDLRESIFRPSTEYIQKNLNALRRSFEFGKSGNAEEKEKKKRRKKKGSKVKKSSMEEIDDEI